MEAHEAAAPAAEALPATAATVESAAAPAKKGGAKAKVVIVESATSHSVYLSAYCRALMQSDN